MKKKTGARRRPEVRPQSAVLGGNTNAADYRRSGRIVHLELDRMGGVLEADHLGHLQVDIAVDEVLVEYAAGQQEAVVLLELLERLAQRPAHRRNLLQLLGRQVVEILVDRCPWIELVLDAVETGH